MEWKDITTYSQRERESERVPSTWAKKAGSFRIVVTRHMDYPPDVWLLRCPLFERELKARDIAEAKLEALATIRTHLTVILGGLV